MDLKTTPQGWFYSDDDVEVFFGNTQYDESVQSLNNAVRFKRLKQVHGKNILKRTETDDGDPEADGHFTLDNEVALLIRTADCMPVMIHAKKTKKSLVMALHAGWRGVASRIISSGLEQILKDGFSRDGIRIWIGPHIQMESFEIKSDAEEILKQGGNTLGCIHHKGNKILFDLSKLVYSQIQEHELPPKNIYISPIDTFSNLSLHSYRRDHSKAGRLGSYIFIK